MARMATSFIIKSFYMIQQNENIPGSDIGTEDVTSAEKQNEGASGSATTDIAAGFQQTISTAESSVTESGMLTATGERISVDDNPLSKAQHPNDVKFKVKYAKDFKGDKTLPEGSVQIISKESADKFTKLGFGNIIK
jgi:hypothetical protein